MNTYFRITLFVALFVSFNLHTARSQNRVAKSTPTTSTLNVELVLSKLRKDWLTFMQIRFTEPDAYTSIESKESWRNENGARVVFEKYRFTAKSDRRLNAYLSVSENLLQSENTSLDNVLGIADQYCYELQKFSKEPKWKLTKFVETTDQNLDTGKLGFSFSVRRPSLQKVSADTLEVPMALNKFINLTNLEQAKKTTVLLATEDNLQLEFDVTIDGIYDSQIQKTANGVQAKTIVSFNPRKYHLPTEVKQVFDAHDEQHTFEAQIRYDWQNELPVQITTSKRHKARTKDQVIFDVQQIIDMKVDYTPIPLSDFRLSAFGFPETPSATPVKTKNWATSLLLAGIGLALLGAFFAYLRSRSGQATA